MKKIIFCMLWTVYSVARQEDTVQHVLEGNLALPTSQQPSPLFSFGQNIVDKKDMQLFGWLQYLNGKNSSFTEITPYILYGISNNLSLYAGLPIAAQFKFNDHASSGVQDIFAQFEYAFYNQDAPTFAHQMTAVANVTFPTGSADKNPITGFGSPSFFVGLTASHLSTKWYYFISPGATITIPKNNNNFGNTFLYQAGMGRNIYAISSKLIISALVEFFGAWNSQNNTPGIVNQRFNKNHFTIGPSLWIATQHFIFQTGIAFPLTQTVNGLDKSNYLFSLDIGWKFN